MLRDAELFRLGPVRVKRSWLIITAVLSLVIIPKIGATRRFTAGTDTEVHHNITPPLLLGLPEVIEEIAGGAASNKTAPLVIDHLALDLTSVCDELKPRLLPYLGKREIRYRLLILAKPEDGKNVPGEIGHVLKSFSDQPNSHFQFEIRQFSEVPMAHGFRISAPPSRSFYFMAFPRGEKTAPWNKWAWGSPSYLKLQAPAATREDSDDFTQIFDGAFKHLWDSNRPGNAGGSSP